MTRIPEPLLSRYMEKLNDKLSESTALNTDLRQLAAAIGSSDETTRSQTRRRINWCVAVSYSLFCFEVLADRVPGFPPTSLPGLLSSERIAAEKACKEVLSRLSLQTAEEELVDAEQWRGLQQLSEAARARVRRMGTCVLTMLEEGEYLTPPSGAPVGAAFFDFLVAAGRSSDDLVKYASLLSEVHFEQRV